MLTNFLDLFHLYLIPFAIAVPIAIFVIYISTRNVADRQVGERELEERAREKLRQEEEKMALYQQEKRRAEEAESERRLRAEQEAERRRQAELAEAERRIQELREAEQRIQDLAEETRRNAERAVAYPPPIDLSAPAATDQVSVLVVDDSTVARVKLKKLFESTGYHVEVAEDGQHALEALQKAHFHVLVTDLEMPNMDGFELIAAVQGSLATEDLPIIAITGHDEMQARVHDMKGLFGIFKKPWNDRDLLKRVQQLSTMRARMA